MIRIALLAGILGIFSPGLFSLGTGSLGICSLGVQPAEAQGRRSSSKEDSKEKEKAEQRQLEEALRRATRKVNSDYCKNLETVSLWCAKNGLRSDAVALYKKIRSLDAEYKNLPKLKTKIKASSKKPDEGTDLAKLEKTYNSKIKSTDEKQAKRLYSFAVKCFKFGLFTRAYDMLQQVLVLAPDPKNREQKKARDILGFTYDRKEKIWITDWVADQKKKSFLTEEGWVLKKSKKKWESGLRPIKGKWVTIDDEKRIRGRSEYNPYQVTSENFIVKTNLGRKEAWNYAVLLEGFNREFYRFFIGYYDQVAGAKLLFKRAESKSRHEVYVYPSRKEFVLHIKAENSNDELLLRSAGFYSPSDRVSRFYWSEDITSTLNTLYHEIAHQLFAETKDGGGGGNEGNNWVVEGIATYIETWENKDGKWYPGRKTDIPELQMVKAFFKSSSKSFLESYVHYEHSKFHKQGASAFSGQFSNRGLNYALGCALSHFFLHASEEEYRERYVKFLSKYYAGRVSNDSVLANVAQGMSYRSLEKALRKYILKL